MEFHRSNIFCYGRDIMAFLLNLILFAWLVSCENQQCLLEWNLMFQSQKNSSIPSKYFMMYQNSGFRLNDLGNYDDCNSIDIAKYVLFQIPSKHPIVQTACGPISCTEDDYYNNPPSFLLSTSYDVIFSYEYQQENYTTYSIGAIAMIIFISAVCFVVLVSTVTDILIKNSEFRKNKIFAYIFCFSLINNVKKLLTIRSLDRFGKRDTLEMLNSVRVLSIGWVILGHTGMIYITILPLSNPNSELYQSKKSYFVIGLTGFFSVDTFFWMSGLLMAYLFILDYGKKDYFPVMKLFPMYLHRYLRLTPVYIFCILFTWSMEPYIGSGPLWVDITNIFNSDCPKYWYSNILYISNFIPNKETSLCLKQSWYLSNDMQFSIISLLILMLYIKNCQKFVWCIFIALNILAIATAAIVAHQFDLNPMYFASGNGTNYFNYYYTKPYTRLPAYVFGLACGMIIFSHREFNNTSKVYDKFALYIGIKLDNKYIRCITVAIGFFIINFLIFIQYELLKNPGNNLEFSHWSQNTNITFIALERFFYGLGLSMVLLPILLGHFSFIHKVMSANIWSVMSKIVFVVYLLHYQIIETALLSTKDSVTFSEFEFTKDAFYFFFLSFVCSVPIVLGIEMPFYNLEKLFFSSPVRVHSRKETNLEESKLRYKD